MPRTVGRRPVKTLDVVVDLLVGQIRQSPGGPPPQLSPFLTLGDGTGRPVDREGWSREKDGRGGRSGVREWERGRNVGGRREVEVSRGGCTGMVPTAKRAETGVEGRGKRDPGRTRNKRGNKFPHSHLTPRGRGVVGLGNSWKERG